MVFFINSRRGQSALEFLVLIGFALLIISALLIVFQNKTEDMYHARQDALINQMFNLVLSEFDFAIMSQPVYNRTFYLPSSLDGFDYNITIYDDRDVVLTYLGNEYVRFLSENHNVVGNFTPGSNVIIKYSNRTIFLN